MRSEETAQVDRREPSDRRSSTDRRQRSEPVAQELRAGNERREKVERRRQIDPTTCERDYTADEIEFMKAIDRYRRENGRPFPTWSEVLEVLRDLGYSRPEGHLSEQGSGDPAAGTANPSGAPQS